MRFVGLVEIRRHRPCRHHAKHPPTHTMLFSTLHPSALAAAVGFLGVVNQYMAIQVVKARKQYNVPYPEVRERTMGRGNSLAFGEKKGWWLARSKNFDRAKNTDDRALHYRASSPKKLTFPFHTYNEKLDVRHRRV